MKLGRFKWQDQIMYGAIEGDDVFAISGDIFGKFNVGSKLCKVEDVRFLTPVEPRNILNIGLNFGDTIHKRVGEIGMSVPVVPIVFVSTLSSVSGPLDDIVYPVHMSKDIHSSPELVAIIGKKARLIPENEVKNYIFGYTGGNDLAALDISDEDFNRTGRCHNFDTFSPFGPVINTEVDGDNIRIRSKVNGKVVKDRNTSEMIYSINKCIYTITQVMTLSPGDIVFLGSVGGVTVNIGDVIEAEFEGIGTLKNTIVAPK